MAWAARTDRHGIREERLEGLNAAGGERVAPEHIPVALTAGGFAYDDRTIQVFDPDGGRHVRRGRASEPRGVVCGRRWPLL